MLASAGHDNGLKLKQRPTDRAQEHCPCGAPSMLATAKFCHPANMPAPLAPKGDLDVTIEDDLDMLSRACDQQVTQLSKILVSLESKYNRLAQDVSRREEDDTMKDRLALTEAAVQQLKQEFEGLRDLEQQRRREVYRLEAVVEAERLQHSLTEHRLSSLLAEEQLRAERLRLLGEDAVSQKEDAMTELACAYADMEAMQATLADSAVYVRYLRRKVLELELEVAQNAACDSLGASARLPTQPQQDAGTFSLGSIKTAICAAVDEAFKCGEDERKKRLKQLQLRWHPDKNPVLTEMATEVTKLINEAVTAAEKRKF